MIKKLFAQGGRAVVAEIPEPELRPGEVLIAPAFSIVSAGTETATIAMSADPARIQITTTRRPTVTASVPSCVRRRWRGEVRGRARRPTSLR